MNIVAHGLWGVALTPKKHFHQIKWSMFWSVFPDLPFLAVFIPYVLWKGLYSPSDWADLPRTIVHIYSASHSLVIWTVVAAAAFMSKKWRWPMIFWLLHILADIPGHTYFQTPFLFPVSEFKLSGIFSWGNYAISTISHLIPLIIILWKYKILPRQLSFRA